MTSLDPRWPRDTVVMAARDPVAGAIGLAVHLTEAIAGYVELAQPETIAHLVVRRGERADAAALERVLGNPAARRISKLLADQSPSAANPRGYRLPATGPPARDTFLRLAQVEMIRHWLQVDLDERLLDVDLMSARCEALLWRGTSADSDPTLAAVIEYGNRVAASADHAVPAPRALTLELLRVLDALPVPTDGAALGADHERVRSKLILLAESGTQRQSRFGAAVTFAEPPSNGARDTIRSPLRRRDLPARILAFGSKPEIAIRASGHLAHIVVPAFPGGVYHAGEAQLVVRLVDLDARLDLAWAELEPDSSGTQFCGVLASCRDVSDGLVDGSLAVDVLLVQDADVPWKPPDLAQLATDNATLDALALVRAGISAHAVGDPSWTAHLALAASCLAVSNRDFGSAQRAQLHQMRQFRGRVAAALGASGEAGATQLQQGSAEQVWRCESFTRGEPMVGGVDAVGGTEFGEGLTGESTLQQTRSLPDSLRPTLAELDACWTAARQALPR